MFSEVALAVWSAAGLSWSFLSWRLVAGERPCPAFPPEANHGEIEPLSIFKPLPPLGGNGIEPFGPGLESFLMQLGNQDELLLGVHARDEAVGNAFAKEMTRRHPRARLKLVVRSQPDDVANPKVAWQKILAPRAEGTLWLWSDSDIIAPPGYLRSVRDEFAESGAGMLTSPYVVGEAASTPALLDALFVNVEFFPGVLLLRRFGPVDFGLGAGMLFRRADFLEKVDALKLGAALADDFVLGQALKPVRIGTARLTTRAEEATWKDAILHHLRWSKTVRWNRPGGTAARLIVLPIIGWLVYCCFHPMRPWSWLGLAGMMQTEVLFAALICHRIGLPFRIRHGLMLEFWTLWRCLVWWICWIPWPVHWRGQKWPGPYLNPSN